MTNNMKNNKPDTTKEILTLEQFNKNMALMLSWGYVLCAIVSFFFGSRMLSYIGNAFFLPLMLCIICYVAMYFTANPKIQMVIFHLSALNLSPVFAVIYMYIMTLIHTSGNRKNTSVNGTYLAAFWLMIAVYVLILFLLSKTWRPFFSKARYVIAAAIIYTVIMTMLAGALTGLWVTAFAGFFLFSMYVGLNWFHVYQNAQGSSKYYAVTESCRIMNLFGTAFDMKGKTIPPFVQR